ncbi:MAG: hypothetical protein J6X18_01135 [Bacteroidales bacterium]|nr:hypothetical protein [Bacteroidales bacterium]
MCLLIEKSFKAEKPLKVYKVLERLSGGNYQTPYRHCHVSSKIVRGEEYFEAEGIQFCPDIKFAKEGFIHCFVDLKTTSNEWFNYYSSWFFKQINKKEFDVFECEVPVGVDYFVGYCEGLKGVAARKIRFVRRVDEKELEEQRQKNEK